MPQRATEYPPANLDSARSSVVSGRVKIKYLEWAVGDTFACRCAVVDHLLPCARGDGLRTTLSAEAVDSVTLSFPQEPAADDRTHRGDNHRAAGTRFRAFVAPQAPPSCRCFGAYAVFCRPGRVDAQWPDGQDCRVGLSKLRERLVDHLGISVRTGREAHRRAVGRVRPSRLLSGCRPLSS
jgi:hypothetical protein